MPPEGSNLYGNADSLIMQTAWSVPLVSASELEIKKILRSSFLVTNWRNIVARYKFLVTSLYNVNDAAHSLA